MIALSFCTKHAATAGPAAGPPTPTPFSPAPFSLRSLPQHRHPGTSTASRSAQPLAPPSLAPPSGRIPSGHPSRMRSRRRGPSRSFDGLGSARSAGRRGPGPLGGAGRLRFFRPVFEPGFKFGALAGSSRSCETPSDPASVCSRWAGAPPRVPRRGAGPRRDELRDDALRRRCSGHKAWEKR